MAADNSLSLYLKKNNLDFELFFKEYLNDNLDLSGIDDNTLNNLKKLINSVRYWGPQLSKQVNEKSVMFTTFSPSPSTVISHTEIFKELQKFINLDEIIEIYFPENRRYMGIDFKNEKIAGIIRDSFKMVGEAYIVNVSWLAEARIFAGRLHWLPMSIDTKVIYDYISEFFIVKSCCKVKMHALDKVFLPTNVIEFSGLLKPNLDIEKVPYLFELKGSKILLTIKGRKPVCLNCKSIGHIKANCRYSYCKRCKLEVLKDHSCEEFEADQSYAKALKKDNLVEKKVVDKKENDNLKKENDVTLNKDPSDDTWINVKRNNSKSYSKANPISSVGASSQEAELWFDRVQKDAEDMEAENTVLNANGSPLLYLPTEAKTYQLKRKLDLVPPEKNALDLRQCVKSKLDVQISSDSDVETSNRFEILDSCASEADS